MSTKTLRIATRKSPLAIWQAEHVADTLRKIHPQLRVELIRMSTRGDKILDTPLSKIGGKGLFVKELEQGLLSDKADIAVHSMKDVPVAFPAGLHLAVILAREDPRDAFVSNRFDSIDSLPQRAHVGTASLRRQCQLLKRRPDLQITPLRGNVNTRLKKLDDGEYDAIILAAAGLIRLQFGHRIGMPLSPDISLPAIGQGAIGIECREHDARIEPLLAPLHHTPTATCVLAERAMNQRLMGGCQAPIAGHATLSGDELTLHGLVGDPDNGHIIRATRRGSAANAQQIGTELAEELLANGAEPILKALYQDQD